VSAATHRFRYRRAALQRALAAVLCMLPAVGRAHDARPLAVTLLETAHGVYRVTVIAPPSLDPENVPRVVWPQDCDVRERAPLRAELLSSSVVACRGGLTVQTVRIAYPLYNPALSTLFRLELADGTRRSAVLPPDELAWTVPAEPSGTAVIGSYVALGVEHIGLGFDHLLFVAGLMLLARTRRRILLAVTGFTAAHSITLSLAALGVVRVPVAPIEALIALSIVFLARELAVGDASSFGYRYPLAVSFAFGLLHGFGFAGALGAIGLPKAEIAMGLVGFNVGVELGQVVFIVALLGVVLAWRAGLRRLGSQHSGRWLPRGAAGYVLGVPATFWTLERTLAAFVG
jgi:HupE / UreJ protein